jgi:hypothetical protein
MKYYSMEDDIGLANRWWLGELLLPEPFGFWAYVKVGKIDFVPQNLEIELTEMGMPLDITMAAFDVLIVNEKAKEIFEGDDVQLIPVTIKSLKSSNKYFVVVTLFEEDCVDEIKSEFEKFKVDDEVRPDKAGQYSGISKLVINSSKYYAHSIFRVKGYGVAIIVSEALKINFERLNLKGVRFKDINE